MSRESSERDIAIPKLVEAHGGQIYGLGLRMCGTPQAAEELVQETFLQAFRKWDQFEGRSQASTWLYTIAARLCRRLRRRRAGEPLRLDSLERLLHKYRQVASRQEDPLQSLLRKEEHQAAGAAIAELPTDFRLPLLLKELADLPIARIAAALGLKESTVKTRIHRARLFLATELAKLREGHSTNPSPRHSRQACLELLHAKQDAIDRGVALDITDSELCDRCRMLFTGLEWASEACRASTGAPLPVPVKKRTTEALRRHRPVPPRDNP